MISLRARGSMRMVSMRPARLSATLGRGEHIRAAGRQKAPSPLILVDCLLYREQQIGYPLHLVDDGAVQSSDEACGIRPCGIKGRLVIEVR
jgi:hypothetical protein